MPWILGYIQCQVTAGHLERFMNLCRHHEIELWKVCEKENYTAKQLADNINTILEQYGHRGDKWTIGRRSHESYINSLKQFRKFVLVQRFGGANA